MNNSLVSIIVPNFNNGRYLEECIDSVINQSYKNVELIIIDDASTDNSVEIIKKYQDQYSFIKLIENKSNYGVAKCRNIGLKNSMGEYITTLDSDDYYYTNEKIHNEINLLNEKFHQYGEKAIAYSDVALINKSGSFIGVSVGENGKEGDLLGSIISRSCPIPRDFIVRKKQVIDVGVFDENIKIYEDWDLKIRLSRNNYFVYTRQLGVAYRDTGTGLSSVNKLEHIRWMSRVFKKNIHMLGQGAWRARLNFIIYIAKHWVAYYRGCLLRAK